MTRKHFTIFAEVCRFLNFSQAAEALNTTQPAVSLAVKELESHYGVALFERMNRRVYLTPAGEALLATAQDVLRGFQEAEETLGRGRPLGSVSFRPCWLVCWNEKRLLELKTGLCMNMVFK